MTASCVIIIPFVSLTPYVYECLDVCLALDYAPFHIALLPDIPIELSARYQQPKISVHVTGNITISAKRNLAINYFPEADYIALIDSDAFPEHQWLMNAIRFLEQNRDVWGIGGPNITPPKEPLRQRAVGNAQRTFVVSGPLAFAKKRSKSRYCNHLHSCNLILPRHIFGIIGGFDETLFTGEDRNLCDRIRATGNRIFFHQDVVVYHHNRSLWIPFLLQRVTYGYCSSSIIKRKINRNNLLLYLPLAWLGLFCMLVLYEILAPSATPFALWFAAGNLAATALFAISASERCIEVPYTLAAILVCYIGTTVGQLLAITGISINIKRIYSNIPPEHTAPERGVTA